MSDSKDASVTPTNVQIESTLKRVVAKTFKTDRDSLSVKSVRKVAEVELGLPDGWLKKHSMWKDKSSRLISSEFERLDKAGVADTEDDDGDDDEVVVKKTTKRGAATATPNVNARKRKSTEEPKKTAKAKPKPRKKRKVSSDEEDEASESEAVTSASDGGKSEPVAKKAAAKPSAKARNVRPKAVVDSDSEDNAAEDTSTEPAILRQEPKKKNGIDDDESQDDTSATKNSALADTNGSNSDSDMSVLIDEPPTKKKPQKKLPSTQASKAKPPTKSKPAAKKAAKDVTPDEEEIKRLQGWLVKCGVRKVWGKELKPFETPREKIAHLKSLLTDVGMTGRYSTEKASQIKEQRELAADLEAVTAFDKNWGGQKEERRSTGAKDLGIDLSLLDDSGEERD